MRKFWPLVCLAAVMAWGDPIQLEEGGGKQWYKGNTHTHTLWSDGEAAPDWVVNWYKEMDYDFLSLTEHNVLAVGERWVAYGEGRKVSDDHVADMKAKLGEDWVETRDRGGRTEVRLKTLAEMQERFDEEGKFILVAAEEITSASPSIHVNGINIREQIAPARGGPKWMGLRKNVGAVDEQSEKFGVPMFAHADHPNWNVGWTATDLLEAGNVRFFEVYNGHGGVHNNGRPKDFMVSTDRLWDIALSIQLHGGGPTLYGVATDDAHAYFEMRIGLSNPFRGWSMVLADDLTGDALVEAFRRGDFYATSGVTIESIHADDKEMRVNIAADEGVEYTTQFIGTKKGFDTESTPILNDDGSPVPNAARKYSDEIGVVLHETTENPAEYTMQGGELYVRAKIVSSRPHPNPHAKGDTECAWVQPYVP